MTEEDFKKDYPSYLNDLSHYVKPSLCKYLTLLLKEGTEDLSIPKMKTQNDARGFVYCLFKERCDQENHG